MEKPAVRSAVRILCFLLLLALVLILWNNVVKAKYGDGIYGLTKFYELEDDTVDVLFLGSSHAFEHFNTGVLWDEYGMASFVLGGSIQPMWNTYAYLREALKTQHPRLIVLEGYCTYYAFEYIDDTRIVKNNFGLRWSENKAESLKVSAPEERWPQFFLEYIQYHGRYKDITRADFLPNQGKPLFADWKGFANHMDTVPFRHQDVSGVTESTELFPKTEEYYRAILNLAKEEGIPILVVITPFPGVSEELQRYFNRAGEIAAEEDVPFINCNSLTEELEIDYAAESGDFYHLNYKGNQKLTRYIGRYLSENYSLPDHRGEEKYGSWQRNADYLRQTVYDQETKECTDLPALLEKVRNPAYWLFVSVDGTCRPDEEDAREILDGLGVPDGDSGGIWQLVSGDVVWASGYDVDETYITTAAHVFHLTRRIKTSGMFENKFVMDRTELKKTENGINVLVYDPVADEPVICFGMDADKGYRMVKNQVSFGSGDVENRGFQKGGGEV